MKWDPEERDENIPEPDIPKGGPEALFMWICLLGLAVVLYGVVMYIIVQTFLTDT